MADIVLGQKSKPNQFRGDEGGPLVTMKDVNNVQTFAHNP